MEKKCPYFLFYQFMMGEKVSDAKRAKKGQKNEQDKERDLLL